MFRRPLSDSTAPEAALRASVEAAWQAAGRTGEVSIAFSGGLDSTVLLRLAADCRPPDARLHALHVHHGLQPAADQWLAHCQRIASACGVELRARRVEAGADTGGSEEARARQARYGVFAERLAEGGEVWLAHHADDQLETLLLHLLQGRGLYGMPAQRPLAGGRLRRPLLEQPRAALAAAARELGLDWVEDPSNQDERHDRSFLRRRILPLLSARFPGLAGRLRAVAAERQAALEGLAQLAGLDPQACALPLATLERLPGEQRVAVLRTWLQLGGRRLPSRRALGSFVAQLTAADHARPTLPLADGASLHRYRGWLWWVPPLAPPAPPRALPVPGRWRLAAGELHIDAAADGLALREPLRLAARRGGERLRVRGHQRPVKALLQAAGIPPWLRPHWPLIADADGLAVIPQVAVRDGLALAPEAATGEGPQQACAPPAGPPADRPRRLRVHWRLDPRLR